MQHCDFRRYASGSAILGFGVATVLLVAESVALAGGGSPPQRVTPIVYNLEERDTWDSLAIGGRQDNITTMSGALPVVTHQGKKAVRVQVAPTDQPWSVGFTRAWVRFYLDDYLPNGTLELTVCGEQGRGTFSVGFMDAEKKDRQPRMTTLPLARYGSVTTTWQTIRVPLSALVAAAPKPLDLADCVRVVIAATNNPRPMTIYVRDFQFVTDSPERVYPTIKVDQVGYRPSMRKLAKISAPADQVRVVDMGTGREVLAAAAHKTKSDDPASGDSIWEADFSSLTRPQQLDNQ